MMIDLKKIVEYYKINSCQYCPLNNGEDGEYCQLMQAPENYNANILENCEIVIKQINK